MPNFKSIALTVIELYTHKSMDHVTLATPPFRAIFRGHDRTVLGNIHAKFKVYSFNCFGAVNTGLIDWCTAIIADNTVQSSISQQQLIFLFIM